MSVTRHKFVESAEREPQVRTALSFYKIARFENQNSHTMTQIMNTSENGLGLERGIER